MNKKPICGLYRCFLQEKIDKNYLSKLSNAQILGENLINNNYLILVEYSSPEISLDNLGGNL